ncbi:DUF4232 domain-containing protein [Streptomyces sp. NBC_00878]|uniref:DUF4232 domain-containing protein n=1 Tax=Streptomyces sp. NBC_00878 TaxID=2975854 RepID=UPI002250FF12|nr:DUF4232 domain-containing protein [Streptomyces sp. NBC_00878]MCX4910729.1 DUF4232 domain-containing protein [Streptomyces sp. NBC_00878]
MTSNRRRTSAVSAALVGGAMLMTACQGTETDAAKNASSTPAGDSATASGSAIVDDGRSSAEGSDEEVSDGEGSDGGRKAVRTCGANDISWSTKSETQAGGYILITAKAESGITCALPAALPRVDFGADGTEAGPAEKSVGGQITLSGGTTAYAGVNPKSADGDAGKELDRIIIAIGNDDPNPVFLPVETVTVDDPIVTNWHTSAADVLRALP